MSAILTPSSAAMTGNATFTMLVSRQTMKVIAMTVNRIAHLLYVRATVPSPSAPMPLPMFQLHMHPL